MRSSQVQLCKHQEEIGQMKVPWGCLLLSLAQALRLTCFWLKLLALQPLLESARSQLEQAQTKQR